MRDPVNVRKWSALLIIGAAAACSAQAGNDVSVDNAAANGEAAFEASEEAAGNAAAPPADGIRAAPRAKGNDATFRASGTEPSWSLTINNARMVYDSADGTDVTVATPGGNLSDGVLIYPTPEMTVEIELFRDCQDDSGELTLNRVVVRIGTQRMEGCGSGSPPI